MESGQNDELIYPVKFLSTSTECEHLDEGITHLGAVCDGMDQRLTWSGGAMFDMRRNTKKASRKAALNKGGSERMSQATEIEYIILMSNTPRTVGEYVKLIFILLKYAHTKGLSRGAVSQ